MSVVPKVMSTINPVPQNFLNPESLSSWRRVREPHNSINLDV